jgi:hypothetical protein
MCAKFTGYKGKFFLYVCEKYGILGENFLVCPENFLYVCENYGILGKQFSGEILISDGRAN